MKTEIKNLEHSVRQRLLDISKKRRVDYQFCLTHYCLERFLYRLSHSIHADKFVLKGALLLLSWPGGLEGHGVNWWGCLGSDHALYENRI